MQQNNVQTHAHWSLSKLLNRFVLCGYFAMFSSDTTERLLRDCWATTERLLREYWETTEGLLREYWETAEGIPRDYWETPWEINFGTVSKNKTISKKVLEIETFVSSVVPNKLSHLLEFCDKVKKDFVLRKETQNKISPIYAYLGYIRLFGTVDSYFGSFLSKTYYIRYFVKRWITRNYRGPSKARNKGQLTSAQRPVDLRGKV